MTKVCLRHVPLDLDVRAEIPGMVPKVDSFGLYGSFPTAILSHQSMKL